MKNLIILLSLATLAACNEFKFDQIDFVTHPEKEIRLRNALISRIETDREKENVFGDLMMFKKDKKSYYATFYKETEYWTEGWFNTKSYSRSKCFVGYKEAGKIFDRRNAEKKELECKKWKTLAKIVETGAGYTHSPGWEPVDVIDLKSLKTSLTRSTWNWQNSVTLPIENHTYHWKWVANGHAAWQEIETISKTTYQRKVEWEKSLMFFEAPDSVRPEQLAWRIDYTTNYPYRNWIKRHELERWQEQKKASFVVIGKKTQPDGRRKFMLRVASNDDNRIPQLDEHSGREQEFLVFNSDIKNASDAKDLFPLSENGACLTTLGRSSDSGGRVSSRDQWCWYLGANQFGENIKDGGYQFTQTGSPFRYVIVDEPRADESYIDIRFWNGTQEVEHWRLNRK